MVASSKVTMSCSMSYRSRLRTSIVGGVQIPRRDFSLNAITGTKQKDICAVRGRYLLVVRDHSSAVVDNGLEDLPVKNSVHAHRGRPHRKERPCGGSCNHARSVGSLSGAVHRNVRIPTGYAETERVGWCCTSPAESRDYLHLQGTLCVRCGFAAWVRGSDGGSVDSILLAEHLELRDKRLQEFVF